MQTVRRLIALLASATLVPAVLAQSDWTPDDREKLVRALVEAFNDQDADAIAQLVTTDVQWLNVNGTTIVPEAGSREELRKDMTAYFKSCPTCRSKLSSMMATPSRVTAIEVASWDSASGPMQQMSVSVYEFSGRLINRVYYFPAEP